MNLLFIVCEFFVVFVATERLVDLRQFLLTFLQLIQTTTTTTTTTTTVVVVVVVVAAAQWLSG